MTDLQGCELVTRIIGTEVQTRHERVFKIVEAIKKCETQISQHFITMGACLSVVHEERLHADWGEHIVTFDDFLRDIGVRRSWAWNAIGVWKKFGERDLAGVSHDRLVKLLPVDIKEEEKDLWIEKARELPAGAFWTEVQEARGESSTGCDHQQMTMIYQCDKCGMFMKTLPVAPPDTPERI